MQKISTHSFPVLIKMLNGKKVHMVSDCEFFPNFDKSLYDETILEKTPEYTRYHYKKKVK